jgi:hypothetical protein
MDEPESLHRLAAALNDVAMHMNLLALLPWTVHVDHAAGHAERERAAAQERAARLLTRIPVQRSREITLPRRTPAGTPATPNTRWGTRSGR